MSFDQTFLELMPETVQIAPLSSRDEYGAPTYGPNVSRRARVLEALEKVVDDDGREVMATTLVWVAPDPTAGLPVVSVRDRVTLPDGSTPPLLRVERVSDEDGPHHLKIYLGTGGGGREG